MTNTLTVYPNTIETHETGLALAERYRLSTYDAMIAAAALLAGCDTLWSEDVRHGTAWRSMAGCASSIPSPDRLNDPGRSSRKHARLPDAHPDRRTGVPR